VPEPRTLLPTSQNREPVSQQHRLHVLGELSSAAANEQPQSSSNGKVGEGEGASSDPARPRQRTRSRGLARFGGFWYPRARVKQDQE
jgi:hypothetical protein